MMYGVLYKKRGKKKEKRKINEERIIIKSERKKFKRIFK